MNRAKIESIWDFDELLQIAESKDVEKREYALILCTTDSASIHTTLRDLSQKRLWRGSVKEHDYFKEGVSSQKYLVVKAKLRVLKGGTWFVGSEEIAHSFSDLNTGATKPEDWEIKLDEDGHAYKVYRYGEEKFRVYWRTLLRDPENIESGRRGGRKRKYNAWTGKALKKAEEEAPWLMDKFYEEFPEMVNREERAEKNKQYNLCEKYGISTEGFDESELLPENSPSKRKKFEKFYTDFLRKSGYEQKIGTVKTNKWKTFNRYIQNIAKRFEKKGFEFQEELKE